DVIRSIEEQEQSTPELEKAIKGATVLQRVEDLYRPYKQKRRTKATIAKEKGLQGLADWLLKPGQEPLKTVVEQYISAEKGVETTEEAIAGAQDILAELF
ncbi:Tex-like N-terminal domain-containing protein, partial [Streptococcus pneumoniae]|nr:Tex-like N-terminal domain-containing protein [Streptococcus pneumoniae]